jgi:1,4-dihydroxy-2-naphthoate octaprenyltransferase
MATATEWLQGTRPRTLPAAVAPVLVGAGVAQGLRDASWWRCVLALAVAVLLQIGVNFANDYSDGVRGTDSDRIGPVRLVGQRRASAAAVRAAAVATLGAAALIGFILVASIGEWWLLIVGAAAIAAAWLYTGGPRPYGYLGLGEIFVMIFFGLVPVVGTTYVSTLRIEPVAITASVGVGALACAILVANNLRDIPTDTIAGKATLAVRIGDARTRTAYLVLVAVSVAAVPACVLVGGGWWGALIALVAVPLLIEPARAVYTGALGRELIPVLGGTGQALLAYGLLLGSGLAFGPL